MIFRLFGVREKEFLLELLEGLALGTGSPQHRFNAGKVLLGFKGLRQVIICAKFKSLDTIVHISSIDEHDGRQRALLLQLS